MLANISRERADSIGILFRKEYPYVRFRRVVLFTPYPASSALPLMDQQPLTIVLPSFVPYTSLDSSVPAVTLSQEDAVIAV